MSQVCQYEQDEDQQHDEIAMRGIGQSHDAEHQGLAHCEKRIKGAEQHALQEDIDE